MLIRIILAMKKSNILSFTTLLCAVFLVFMSCKKNQQKAVADQQSAELLDSIASNYYEHYLQLYPLEATMQGDKRYNDQLPINISKKFISEEISFYNSIQNQLRNIDYGKLKISDKVVYDVLDTTIKDKIERYAYHPEYFPFTQFGGLPLDFPLLGSGQGSQPFKTVKDYDDWLKRAEKFPAWMDQAISNFRTGLKEDYTLPKVLVKKMIAQMNAEELQSKRLNKNIFYGPIKKFPSNFTEKQKNEFTTRFKVLVEDKIIPAYQKMGDFLETEYLPNARETDGYNALPKGSEIYNYYVKSWTTTNKKPDEIHKIGLQEVARIRSEMEAVKQELGFEGTLVEFLDHLKKDPKAKPYKNTTEIINAFNGILKKIEPKLKTMFHVTPKTPFKIRQTEKFRENTASAEYQQGTPDGKRPGIFYVPLPNPKEFNVTSGMESLFLHEAIPGHHFQLSLQQENTGIPKFMRFGWYGAYGEGWAHYCEFLGSELGLYTDPYQKMGALSDQMLRAVRLVIDTGIHTGQMTREEAIKYYLNNVSSAEQGATAEIERYMAMPGQALSYKMGQMKFAELRAKYTKNLGAKFDLAAFHDEVLNQGCLPLDVLERKMELWAERQKSTK